MKKEAGKHFGRARKLTIEQISEARGPIDAGVPKTGVARLLGVNCASLDRALALIGD